MAGRVRRIDEALANSRLLRTELGREIRNARLGASLSQQSAGAAVAISHAQFGRIERAELPNVSIDQLSRACASVGLRLVARAVPGSGRPIDAGQLALLNRLRRVLPPTITMQTEVPLPIPGDRRAWDAVAALQPDPVAVEAEARLRDIQALDRRAALKLRDSQMARMVLLVADTASNRAMLDAHREDLRAAFPLDGRQLLPMLRAGRTPAVIGILVL